MIPIVDIFEAKRTDVSLASGTLVEMQDLAKKLNPTYLRIANATVNSIELFELFVSVNVSFEIKVNGKEVISSETLADLRLKECNR
jgi:hypothetical protein